MAEADPVGRDQIARRAVLLGELDRNVPGAPAQEGDGELRRKRSAAPDRAKATWPRPSLVGQRPREIFLVDHAEMPAVRSGNRCRSCGPARRDRRPSPGGHSQTPQQRQPFVKFGKQIEGEKKAVVGRPLPCEQRTLERPFLWNCRIVQMRQFTEQHGASLPTPRSARRMTSSCLPAAKLAYRK